MESVGSDTESQHSPEQPSISFSPGTESRIEQWQATGTYPYPELQVFPPPPTGEYSRNELRLIHHLSTVANALRLKGTSNLTIWTEKVPKFLSLAATYPFVMHALLSFSANNLAWSRSSTETRNLHIQHGTIALRGLHEAIGNFSHANADAVLATSLLLLWQATDWRSWSSLRAGIQSVLSSMQSYKHESIFEEYINEEDLFVGSYRSHRRANSIDGLERNNILQNCVSALQRLQVALTSHEAESYWIDQLLSYVQSLQTSAPAQTPEDQFQHLYLLRKWIFWVPALLLQQQNAQGPALLTIAHFYSVALALVPLFPDLGSSFCARVALSPLENILSVTDAIQSQHAMDSTSTEIASLMQFPQQMALHFRSRDLVGHFPSSLQDDPSLFHLSSDTLNYSSMGNMSPAFAPAPLNYSTPSRSSTSSSFLEVPGTQNAGFTYGTQTWGAAPSPGFPPQLYTGDVSSVYEYDDAASMAGFQPQGGFVPPTPIWT